MATFSGVQGFVGLRGSASITRKGAEGQTLTVGRNNAPISLGDVPIYRIDLTATANGGTATIDGTDGSVDATSNVTVTDGAVDVEGKAVTAIASAGGVDIHTPSTNTGTVTVLLKDSGGTTKAMATLPKNGHSSMFFPDDNSPLDGDFDFTFSASGDVAQVTWCGPTP